MPVSPGGTCRQLERRRCLCDVSGVQLDADISSPKTVRDQPHRARAEEGIEHEVARGSGGEDARLHQSLRKRRDMRTAGIGGIDVPHRPAIASPAILRRLLHRLVVIMVLLGLGEHEEVFVCPSGAVLDTFGHDIGLVPHDVAAQIPAILLQRQRQPPRDAHQILVFEPGRIVGPHVHRAIGILFIRCAPAAISTGVAVADVQPQNAVRLEHAFHLRKNVRERLDEARERRLQTDLSRDAVITQTPIRWRGDDALHRFAGQATEREMHVALDHNGIGQLKRACWKKLNRVHRQRVA